MPSAEATKVYKAASAYKTAIAVLFSVCFGGIGIGLIADYRGTGWLGVVTGAIVILGCIGMVVLTNTASVTIHEQGIVIRQNLRREFIPWQAVKLIDYGQRIRDPSVQPHETGGAVPVVWVYLDTGVRYMEEWRLLDGTRGSQARIREIAAEMEAFRRRDQESRRAEDSVPRSRLPRPVTPAPPDTDDYNPPPLGKALW
jgi:hypothetical protein